MLFVFVLLFLVDEEDNIINIQYPFFAVYKHYNAIIILFIFQVDKCVNIQNSLYTLLAIFSIIRFINILFIKVTFIINVDF